jgi:hypothetical protein
MKFSVKNYPWLFSFIALVFSFGAPLGFYLHSFLFHASVGQSLIEHIQWLHQHQLSTILYIGLGTNFFFSVFGFFIGKYAEKVVEQNKKIAQIDYLNLQLKKHKKELTKNLINKVKFPISLSLEYLYHFKDLKLNSNEAISHLDSLVVELKKINNTIEQFDENLTQNQKEVLSIFDFYQILDHHVEHSAYGVCELDKKSNVKEVELLVSDENLKNIFELIFSSFHFHEVMPEKIKVNFYEGRFYNDIFGYQDGLSDFCEKYNHSLAIEFIFENLVFEAHELNPLIENLVQKHDGLFFKKSKSFFILIPTQNKQFSHEAA